MKILLVNPQTPVTFWSANYALEFAGRKALLPPLGLLTVAAMLPPAWEKRLVDLATTELRDEDIRWSDYVFLGGMNIQEVSARQVIARCKALGAKIVAGGPLFTTFAEEFEEVDHLVLGEAEETLPRFLKDLEQGCARHLYRADGWADLHTTVAPLWDLIDLPPYSVLPVQYSRGCPFRCDFCDVTVLFGHRIRTKATRQLLAELDRIHALGWRREVFICDDNFIADRQTVKHDVLPALVKWMEEHEYPFPFYTQASINLADDEELMGLMAQAGFESVFIGIETVGDNGFAECNKAQNKNRDLVACVHKIQQFGMQVQGGFILGFDSDPPSIFDDLIEFIQDSGIVTATVGLLQAPRGTPLYERLQKENRLVGEAAGNTDGITNIIPKMPLEQLGSGYHRVVETLYSPDRYYDRIWRFIETWRPARKVLFRTELKDVRALFLIVYRFGIRGPGRRRFWKLFAWILRHRQERRMVLTLLTLGYHFRKVFAGIQVRTMPAGSVQPAAGPILDRTTQEYQPSEPTP